MSQAGRLDAADDPDEVRVVVPLPAPRSGVAPPALFDGGGPTRPPGTRHHGVLDRAAMQRRAAARRRRRARIRRNRIVAGLIVLGLIATIVMSVDLGGGTARAGRPSLPVLTLASLVAPVTVVPGSAPHFAWPAQGEGAVAVLGAGLMARSPRERSVPIASLTKMMTAYLVLRDHPLGPSGDGPSFHMTAADARAWVAASQSDESNVQVRPGEVLTERQLLEALLLPSADNIADYLAVWDAGSLGRFVAEMNRTAHALGLNSTHYADASGVNPRSRSDASDQAVLASALMQNAAVREVVARPRITFPVAGTIWNFNPALGVDGIIGVKSGFTSAAQGCLATAAFHGPPGHEVLVVAVSLGQPAGLYGAARADEALLARASSALVTYRPLTATRPVGEVTLGSGTPREVALAAPAPLVVGWGGLRITERLVAQPPAVAHASSRPLGELVLGTPDGTLASVPLALATSPAAISAN